MIIPKLSKLMLVYKLLSFTFIILSIHAHWDGIGGPGPPSELGSLTFPKKIFQNLVEKGKTQR